MLYLLGSLGINPVSLSGPSTVPDNTPSVGGVTGSEWGKKPHNVGSLPDPLLWVLLSVILQFLRPLVCVLNFIVLYLG